MKSLSLYPDGLPEDRKQIVLDWMLAPKFVLPSVFALGDVNPDFELAAYRFWLEIEPAAMAQWIDRYPGQRPPAFWWWRSGDEPLRQRLGGCGDTWVTGRRPFSPNRPIGNSRRSDAMRLVTPELPNYGATWQGLPIASWTNTDPASPPIFESEASYLDRRGLLLPGERRRLAGADFEPVALVLRYRWNGTLESAGIEVAQ
jgi:hypothetical protein